MIIVIIFISAIFALITWNILNNHVEIEEYEIAEGLKMTLNEVRKM